MVSAAEAGGRVFGSMGGGLDSDEVRRFFTSCILHFDNFRVSVEVLRLTDQ